MWSKRWVWGVAIVLGLAIWQGRPRAQAALTRPLRINVGGSQPYQAAGGGVYAADQPWSATADYGYVGGRAITTSPARPVGGSPDSDLFQTYREGWQAYRFNHLPAGQYLATFYFIEHSAPVPPQHVFDVALEGQTALAGLNVSAEAGLDYVLARRFVVSVSDGRLDIEATPLAGSSLLSALEIAPFDDDGAPPAAPPGLISLASYRAILLNWDDSPAEDADGYHVYRAAWPDGPWLRLTGLPIHLSRYTDESAAPGVTYRYRVGAVDALGRAGALSAASEPATALELSAATLPTYELTVSAENLAQLYANPYSDDKVPATVAYNGQPYPAEVRFRGNYGREVTKRSWKIDFSDDTPLNSDRINLNGEYVDWTLMRTLLTQSLYAGAGIRPPHMEPVLVFLNGHYQGVYIQIEQMDEAFLERTGREPGSNIYKADYALTQWLADPLEFRRAYEEETNEDGDVSDLIAFSELINFAPAAEFPYQIGQHFDGWRYLNYYAINVLTTNADFTWHNAYLIHDTAADRWEITPWDLDHTWGLIAEWTNQLTADLPLDMGTAGSSQPLAQPSPLLTRLLETPVYKDSYCGQLTALLQGPAAEATIFPQIDALFAALRADALRDWQKYRWDDNSWFLAGPDELKAYLSARRAYIETALDAYCPPAELPLRINELLPVNVAGLCDPDDPDSADCHESWFEIYNAGLTPVDLDGLYVTDDPNQPTQHRIDGTLVVPPLGHALLWADGEPTQGVNHVDVQLAAEGGYLALVNADGSQVLDAVHYGSLAADVAWGRVPDGVTWRSRYVSSPGAGNRLLAPVIDDVSRDPTQPAADQAVTIQATISDDGLIESAQLHYLVGNSNFVALPMLDDGGGQFSALVPGQPDGARVQFYVQATDNEGQIALYPPAAFSWRFGVESRPDTPLTYQVNYQAPSIRLNEFLADNAGGLIDPDEPDELPDWLEIYNPGPHHINLGGMSVTDNLNKPSQFTLSSDLAVPAGGFLVLFADNDPEQGIRHTNFSLKTSESLGLYDAAPGDGTALDTLVYSGQQTDVAYARCPDGDGAWGFLNPPSPGQSNVACGAGRPVVQRVTRDPAYPPADAAVAITARLQDSDAPLSVTLWYGVDGAFVGVPLVYIGSLDYRAVIPSQPAGTTVLYYVTVTDNAGYSSAWPADAPAHSLSYVTGYVRPPLVLNEVMAYNSVYVSDPDEPGETSDWIELYNAGSTALDLGGFSLTDDSAEPLKYPLPAGLTIPAGGFLTIWADDDVEQGPLHAGFTLPYYQGAIYLYGAEGRVLLDQTGITLTLPNRSWGRTSDGDGSWALQTCPSQAAPNRCRQQFLPLLQRP